MPLEVGQKAPDFEAKAGHGTEKVGDLVRLSDLSKDKSVVLAFFVFAWTGNEKAGWIAEMSQFGADLDKFRQLNAEIVGISADSPWVLDRFAKDVGYDGIMVSDFNKQIMQAYDVYNAEVAGLRGVAKRSVFVIDRSGTIRWTWLAGPGQLPSNEDILDVLRKL